MSRRTLHSIIVVCLASSIGYLSLAAAEEAAPAPSPEIGRIAALAGEWEGTGTLNLGGQIADARFHYRVEPFAQGFGVQVHETFDCSLTGHYEAENLVGFDPETRRMHIYSVDNFSETHDHAGRWVNEHTLELLHAGTVRGKRYVEHLTLTLVSPDAYTFAIDATLGGKFYESGVATMHRAGSASR